MTTRFSKSILVLAAAGLLSAGSLYAGNGDCNGTGNGDCTGPGTGNGSGIGNAQFRQGEPGGNPLQRTDRLANRLGLSAGQTEDVLGFLNRQEEGRQQLRAEIWADYGQLICEQREANQGSFHAFLLTILDDDQKALLAEMEADRLANQSRRQGRHGNGEFDCSQFDEG